MTGVSRVLLLFLVGLLFPPWPESFAQNNPHAVLGKEPAPVKGTGRITGRVILAGHYKNPKPFPVFKNRSFCGARVPNETLLVGRDGGLRNAVVTLHPLDRRAVAQPMQLTLDNKQCAFAPHVQVAVVGSEVLLKNSDPILHTVHARLGQETLFNVGLPTWRQVTKRLDRPGIIRIDCDVLHTWMNAAIVVTNTPYFALTDVNGNFLVDPPLSAGQYRAEIWHEKLGTKTIGVAVDGNKGISLDVVYAVNGKY
jgi:plastocyanin